MFHDPTFIHSFIPLFSVYPLTGTT